MLQILKYFCPVQSNYTTCYVVLHFCVHVYLCICVQVFVYLRRGNSSVRVAYVHNIPMISHCGSQLAPWLLFNGACLYMKSRQCQSNETYQMFFHFPRLFFFHSKKFEKGPDPPMVQKKTVIQLFVRLLGSCCVNFYNVFSSTLLTTVDSRWKGEHKRACASMVGSGCFLVMIRCFW